MSLEELMNSIADQAARKMMELPAIKRYNKARAVLAEHQDYIKVMRSHVAYCNDVGWTPNRETVLALTLIDALGGDGDA